MGGFYGVPCLHLARVELQVHFVSIQVTQPVITTYYSHIHLHLISSDFISPHLREKYYNGFHPRVGLFIHLSEVMEWFELPDALFHAVSGLSSKSYALKEVMLYSNLETRFSAEEIFSTDDEIAGVLEM
jgi:hypothetical protein